MIAGAVIIGEALVSAVAGTVTTVVEEVDESSMGAATADVGALVAGAFVVTGGVAMTEGVFVVWATALKNDRANPAMSAAAPANREVRLREWPLEDVAL